MMEKKLLKKMDLIIANQIALYKKLDGIECKLNNKSRTMPDSSWLGELLAESEKFMKD